MATTICNIVRYTAPIPTRVVKGDFTMSYENTSTIVSGDFLTEIRRLPVVGTDEAVLYAMSGMRNTGNETVYLMDYDKFVKSISDFDWYGPITWDEASNP